MFDTGCEFAERGSEFSFNIEAECVSDKKCHVFFTFGYDDFAHFTLLASMDGAHLAPPGGATGGMFCNPAESWNLNLGAWNDFTRLFSSSSAWTHPGTTDDWYDALSRNWPQSVSRQFTKVSDEYSIIWPLIINITNDEVSNEIQAIWKNGARELELKYQYHNQIKPVYSFAVGVLGPGSRVDVSEIRVAVSKTCVIPTKAPTHRPSSDKPSKAPSAQPSSAPTRVSTAEPSRLPTQTKIENTRSQPTKTESEEPTNEPSLPPTQIPSASPTSIPSAMFKIADEIGVVPANSGPTKQSRFSEFPPWLIFVGGCIVGSFVVYQIIRWRNRARREQHEDVEDASETESEADPLVVDSDANTQETLLRYESIGINEYRQEEQVEEEEEEEEMNTRSS